MITRVAGGRDKPFSLRLDPGQRERLDALAAQQGRSMAEVLRRCLTAGLDQEEALQRAVDKAAARRKS